MIFGVLFSFLPLLLIGGIIAAIIAATRRSGDGDEAEPGIGSVRRLFLYGLAFIALMLAATGLSLLLGGLFDAASRETVIAESKTALALGLSLTLVGGVAWALLWWLGERTLAGHDVERRMPARHIYLAAVRGVAYVVVIISAVTILRWLVGVDDFNGEPVGFALVWAAVWFFHQRQVARHGTPTPATQTISRWYLFGAAAVGLGLLGIGLVGFLGAYLERAYDGAFAPALSGDAGGVVSMGARSALAMALVGGLGWAGHWWRARQDAASTIWRVYVLLGSVRGGLATAIIAASIALHRLLQWFFGDPREATAVAHFEALPASVAALLVGLAVWGYHRSVLAEQARRAAQPRSETERVYRYLGAAAGLITLVIGLARVFATTSDLLSGQGENLLRGDGWWQNALVTGTTLLIVGFPLWGRYWLDIERSTVARGEAERGALSRRVFLYGVFGISSITTLISLSILLFQLFEGALENTLSAEILHDARWPIALLLSAAGASVYYLLVLRADRRAQPVAIATPARFPDIVLLGAEEGGVLARRLEERLGTRVRVWNRTGEPMVGALSESEITDILARTESMSGERLLVIAEPGASAVIPYTLAKQP